jgi:hypothetical protein
MSGLRMPAMAALIACGAILATAPIANAATKLGSTAPSGQSQDCFGSTLFVQESSAGPSYVVPSGGGVITSWSAHGFGAPAWMTLKTVRRTSPGNYLIKGSSDEETLAPAGTSTFATRLPVSAGDEIALWLPDKSPFQIKAPCNYVTEDAGDRQAYRSGVHSEPAIGTTYGPTDNGGPYFRLNVSAMLEPDADRDGYGDETQDRCPADATAQGRCPDRRAPRTTIMGGPERTVKTRRKKLLVRFHFRSSEASTFSCTVDRRTKPCASPFRVRVGKGKHTFSVVATDLAGNADASPATTTFEVIRLRRARR